MKPKVSVVIPVYKVEKYINKCVNSIINQTYQELEIILVDDGSPDRCGEILDEYKEKDSRIQVFHKENGGLSDARNFGMRYVTGKYIVFVDSDDWLEETMVDSLLNLAVKHEADIVQGAFYYAYENYLLYDDRWFKENDDIVFLNNKELMKELIINERIKNFAWGKLYRTDLIKDIPFEKGVLFEDIFWAHLVMARVNKYVISHKPLCYYLQRSTSIVADYSLRSLDMIKGLEERHKFISNNYIGFINESYKSIFNVVTQHYEILNNKKDLDMDFKYRDILRLSILNRYNEFKDAFKGNIHLTRRLKAFYKGYGIYKCYMINHKVKLRLTNKNPKTLKRIALYQEGVRNEKLW